MKLFPTSLISGIAITVLLTWLPCYPAGDAQAQPNQTATTEPTLPAIPQGTAGVVPAQPDSIPRRELTGPAAEAQWIHPDWPDPGVKLDEFKVELPVRDVANVLLKRFKDRFDVIIPEISENLDQPINFSDITVKLELKNVTATEVFNAMNILFEAENTPVRWELKMNGSRPVALLKPLRSPVDQPTLHKAPMVYFVGDLVAEGRDGSTANTAHVYETVCKVYDMAFGLYGASPSGTDIKFYEPSQLLIVSATPEKLSFVQDTLKALRDKAHAQSAVGAVAK
jgi:hypothetical protein